MTQNFPKTERLSGQKSIGFLFKAGESSFVFPYRVVVRKHNETTESRLRLLITVPKRNFKKAVDRNRIKRLTRECWRKNKSRALEQLNKKEISLDIALVYTAHTILSTHELEPKIILILQRLIK